MALIVPTDPLPTYTAWDVDLPDKTSWGQRFYAVKRPSQNKQFREGIEVENGKGDTLLRRYASLVMSGSDFSASDAVQNLTEFKLGGVINIAVNQDGLIGLIWNPRAVIPPHKMPEYRTIWADYSNIFVDKTKTTRLNEDRRVRQYLDFLQRVAPLVGMYSLELPRGYGEVAKTSLQTAGEEVEEELQVRCVERIELALIGEDTAQAPALNFYCYARMDVRGQPTRQADLWERIAGKAQWLTLTEVAQAFRDGYLIDPYTLAALQALQWTRPDLYATIAQ